MKNVFSLLCFLLLMNQIPVLAQLNGTYTIGGAGANYTTIAAAVNALTTQGVSGPVTFNINPGTYNEKMNLGNITGASVNNKITFKSSGNDSSSVIISDTSSVMATNNYTLRLYGAKYMIFKGLTFRRTGVKEFAQVVDISNQSKEITFTNCRFQGQVTSNASTYKSLVYSSNGHTSSYISFIKNRFENGAFGVYHLGMGSFSLDNGLTFEGNVFEGQYSSAIRLSYVDSPIVTKNRIKTQSANASYSGIYFFYCAKAIVCTKNEIVINGGNAVYIHNSNGGSGMIGLFENNFITLKGSTVATGFAFEESGTHNIYFNSINVINSSTSSRAVYINGITCAGLAFYNNNLVNAGGGYTYYVTSSTNTPISSSNNNNLYFTGTYMGFWKSTGNVSGFTQWKTLTSLDAQSVSALPMFVNDTNLHAQSGNINNKGTYSLFAPFGLDDIDGETRSYSNPDIGADEFDIDDLAVIKLLFDTSRCQNDTGHIVMWVKNMSLFDWTGNIPLKYRIGTAAVVTENKNNVTLAAGDTLKYHFKKKETFSALGQYKVWGGVTVTPDINRTNDSLTSPDKLSVYAYPTVNLGTDSIFCAGKNLLLNAGSGFTAYQWSNGSNSSTLLADTTGYGIGSFNFWVNVWNHGCKSTDTIKLTFVDCSATEEINDKNQVIIFPNPTSDKWFIQLMKKVNLKKVELLDATGKLLYFEFPKNEMLLEIASQPLKDGVYFLRLTTENQIIISKVIKR